jgi:hypothetical protein
VQAIKRFLLHLHKSRQLQNRPSILLLNKQFGRSRSHINLPIPLIARPTSSSLQQTGSTPYLAVLQNIMEGTIQETRRKKNTLKKATQLRNMP